MLHTANGTAHALDEVLWITEAGAQSWLAASGLSTDDAGFVAVHATLESMSHPGIFAAGGLLRRGAPRTRARRPEYSRSVRVRRLPTTCAALSAAAR